MINSTSFIHYRSVVFLGGVLQFRNNVICNRYTEAIANGHTVRIGLHLGFLELFKAITRLLPLSVQASIRIIPWWILFGWLDNERSKIKINRYFNEKWYLISNFMIVIIIYFIFVFSKLQKSIIDILPYCYLWTLTILVHYCWCFKLILFLLMIFGVNNTQRLYFLILNRVLTWYFKLKNRVMSFMWQLIQVGSFVLSWVTMMKLNSEITPLVKLSVMVPIECFWRKLEQFNDNENQLLSLWSKS